MDDGGQRLPPVGQFFLDAVGRAGRQIGEGCAAVEAGGLGNALSHAVDAQVDGPVIDRRLIIDRCLVAVLVFDLTGTDDDLLAIGAMQAAWNLGLAVPADLSLVGFDDIHMAKYLVPPLTTVAKDTVVGGREAVRQLLARIADPDLPRQKASFPARLIIRESTGPAT